VVQHRLAAAAVNTDALLVHRPQLDFGGIGMDERFNVTEGIRKDGEPPTQMILCAAPAIPQSAYSLYMPEVSFNRIHCVTFGYGLSLRQDCYIHIMDKKPKLILSMAFFSVAP
jgi:hypothetical protein